MYKVTTFEWKGGFKNVPVTTCDCLNEGEPRLMIASLGVYILDDREGHIDITFGMESEFRRGTWAVGQFIDDLVRKIGFSSYSNSGWKYNFSFRAASSEPITETMMRHLMNLLLICGAYTVNAPRIVTESFTGRWQGDENSIPYGEYCMKKVLGRTIYAAVA